MTSRALTCDLWYTLLYFPPRARDAHARRRLAAWADPMTRAGRSRTEAIAWTFRLVAWGRRREAHGYTPTLEEQVRWLARATSLPARTWEGTPDAVDASLLRTPVRWAPGLPAVLRRLTDGGTRLGIVSNLFFESAAATRTLLDRIGLAPWFDAVVLSSEQPWSKPRPEPFRLCLRSLKVRPDRAAHVGDLAYDVVGSGDAGMRSILFTGLHRFERPLPELSMHRRRPTRVDRWSSVPRALDRLVPPAPNARSG